MPSPFCAVQKTSIPAENQDPGMPGKIASCVSKAVSGRDEQSFYLGLLGRSDLDGDHAARLEMRPGAVCDHPIGIKPVSAAIERPRRVEVPDLAWQGRKLDGRNIGRVRDDCMVAARNFFEPVGPERGK